MIWDIGQLGLKIFGLWPKCGGKIYKFLSGNGNEWMYQFTMTAVISQTRWLKKQ